MSIQAVAFVLDMEVPEVPAKMLLVCLANAHNHDTGFCHPSLKRLEKESGMSRRSVIRWLQWLKEHGYVEIEGSFDANDRQRPNDYRLVDFGEGVRLAPRGATVGTGEGVTAVTPEGATVGTPLKIPEELKEDTTKAGVRVDPIEREFDESVWADFPRHRNSRRFAALKAYRNLSQADRVMCMRGVARYSIRFDDDKSDKRPTEDRLRFVPHLSTWIHQRGWEAEMETA